MLKQRIFKIVIALALLAVVGSFSIVADALGLQVTPQVHAGCSGSGGYC